ncbi:hypothetical protein AOQ84DRAFT_410413, partial [Glonium stellatum]
MPSPAPACRSPAAKPSPSTPQLHLSSSNLVVRVMAGPQIPGPAPDPPLDPEIKATLARAFIVPAPPYAHNYPISQPARATTLTSPPPSFNKNVTIPINREERLRTIIKNVEAHNQKVRARIIAAPLPPS